jgi:DNA-directed RNA polymerase specialized sigma subunit
MDDASGGEPLRRVLAEQDLLIQMVQSAKQSAERVRAAMDATEKEARRTKMALERLERLRMATAEVQDLLESAAATANIIGASRFSDDDEMRSFRDYLRHNPPDYPGQAIT